MVEYEETLPRFKDADDDETLVLNQVYLVAISGPMAGTVFTLRPGKMILGRVPEADIFLNDSQVSREHLEITVSEGKAWVADLKSTNGSFLNGEKLGEPIQMEEGDELSMGASSLKFTLENPVGEAQLGLRHHGYFENRLKEELDRALRYNRGVSILMIAPQAAREIQTEREDAFKKAYPKVVMHIQKMIRNMDVLAAYGKFELELMLPETEQAEAIKLAERIHQDVKFGGAIPVSVGLATFPQDGRTVDLLLERSRHALKAALESPDQGVVQKTDDVRKVQIQDKEVIIRSENMIKLFDVVERVAKSNITVLIEGDTGVGKEVVAETIHAKSDRRDQALVCVNCAALTETLLESELFGHEKGAFTGADQRKIGLFETASGGTIFLDEIGEMPFKTQAKLLRVLQGKKIMRVGSNSEIDTDIRVVAATNRNLQDQVKKGSFREDLFYRLNAAVISVPPLRERRDEIPYLVQSFIETFCKENGFGMLKMDPEAMDLLVQYNWPGNIRELRNTIERAVVICEGDTIGREALTSKLTSSTLNELDSVSPGFFDERTVAATTVGDMKEVVEAYERSLIVNALKRVNWNQTKAADALNVPRRTLVSKIKKYDISESSDS